MTHSEELKALWEEVAKLRERIAVLEAKPPTFVYQPVAPSVLPVPAVPQHPYRVTCNDLTGTQVINPNTTTWRGAIHG